MSNYETIFILLFAAILLVGIAQKFHIAYPIALVIGGGVIGFIPGLQPIFFDPNFILVIVLPPVLYYASFGISFRKFKQNWRDIFSLALSLVVVTTFIIGILFKWLFPQLSWALAFAFGAIVSPPDAISATTILKRFSINSRLLTLLEGESLINDASALVLYKIAVVALLSGTFSFTEGIEEFIFIVSGGIIVGLILGLIFQLFSKRYLEPVLGVIFSFIIPYITYIAASLLAVSGVLAVVVNALIGSRLLVSHHSSLRRILGYATWDVFIILLNCFVFILIGLQLRSVTRELTLDQMILYTKYALMITFSIIVIRMIWVFFKSGIAYYRAVHAEKSDTYCKQIFREAAILGWSGMRGIVSLAAAIALPFTNAKGLPIEGRNEVIFMTFVVILLTLLIPGFTLATLLRWLKIQATDGIYHGSNLEKIRDQLAKIAEEKLHLLLSSEMISKQEFDFLKAYFMAQSNIQKMAHDSSEKLQNIELARLKVLQTQRKHLLDMWKHNEIDDKLLTHLENELDLVEVHIARGELK